MEKLQMEKKKLITFFGAGLLLILMSVIVVLNSGEKKVHAAAELELKDKVNNAIEYLLKSGYISETDNTNYYYYEKQNNYYKTTDLTANSQNIPISKQELLDNTPAGKTFSIDQEEDFVALMVLSTQIDLSDYTFSVDNSLQNKTNYDLTATNAFYGISPDPTYPFSGTFMVKFGDLCIQTSSPLFDYLDVRANICNTADTKSTDIYTYTIDASGASAVIANVLVCSDNDYKDGVCTIGADKYSNIDLKGTVSNPSGAAGSMFAEIQNNGNGQLVIESLNVENNSVTQVSGLTAGGLVGKITGNVQVTIGSKNESTIAKVIGTGTDSYAGGWIGSFEGKNGAKLILDGTISLPQITSDGSAGGIAGIVKNIELEAGAVKDTTGNASCQIIYTENTMVTAVNTAGGVAGTMENTKFSHGNLILTVSINENTSASADTIYRLGALCGDAINSTIQRAENTDGVIYVYNSLILGNQTKGRQYAGGLIGSVERPAAADTTEISHIRIYDTTFQGSGYVANAENDNSLCTFMGGVIGYVSDNAKIQITDAELENLDMRNSSYVQDMKCNYFGGIVGYNGYHGLEINTVSVKILTKKHSISGDKVICDTSKAESASTMRPLIVGRLGGIIGYTTGNCSVTDAKDLILYFYQPNQSPADEIIGTNTTNIRTNLLGGIVAKVGDGENQAVVTVQNINYKKLADGKLQNMLMVHQNGDASAYNMYGDSTDIVIGGVAGELTKGSVLCLNEGIDLSNLGIQSDLNKSFAKFSDYGYLVGKQTDALAYMNPTGVMNGEYTYGYTQPAVRYADEIGNYGKVYRNGVWDGSEPVSWSTNDEDYVIRKNDDGTVYLNGNVNITDNQYQLTNEGDFLRLAIALGSGGEYGLSCFGDGVTVKNLLAASYKMTADVKLTNTGILTINRNLFNKKVDGDNTNRFSGTLDGGGYTITYQVSSFYQANLGLFSEVENAVFKNLKLEGTVKVLDQTRYNDNLHAEYLYYKNAGGIAARAYGNLTVTNVTANVSVTDAEDDVYMLKKENNQYVEQKEYYGGLFGYYQPSNDSICTLLDITCKNITLTEKNTGHICGGLIGYLNTKKLTKEKALDMTMDNITMTGSISAVLLMNSSLLEGIKADARIGGLIAEIGSEDDILKKTASTEEKEPSCDNKVYIHTCTNDDTTKGISLSGLTIGDAAASATSKQSVNKLGGLMGYQWDDVDVDFKSVVVSSSSAISLSKTNQAVYGGLWNRVYGHMKLDSVEISDTNFNVPSKQNNNAVLVQNGQYLYLELGTYTLTNVNVTVNDKADYYYDEIVGINQGTVNAQTEDTGGIVSLNGISGYQLYKNQISTISQKNPYTRYYYHLDTDLGTKLDDIKGNTLTIDSTAKLMRWHLAHYANTPLKQYFNVAGYTTEKEEVTFSAALDLGSLSYYPTNVSGGTYKGNGKTITFHGNEFYTDSSNANAFKTKQLLKPYQQNSENYQIQSGLFGNVVASNISNMTISGSANAYKITDTTTVSGTVSGALIAGNILGVVKPEDDTNSTNNGYTLYDNSFVTKITDIVLDNLAIYNPIGDGTNWKSNYGLMVYGISSGANVEFDRICMSNYKDGNHVAAALIGRVGSSTAEAINLTFTNMQIADVKDHGDQEGIGRAGRTVLAYASFIYEYNYRTNTIPDNSSYGLYTFKLEDYKKGLASHTHQDGTTNTYVTLGKEIGETVQFYDDGLNDSIAAYTNDNTKNKEGLVKFSADDYKPYVYQSKQIDVNPKPGSITKGCGTYSDPYIIENTTQLYTLYQYISNHEQYHASLRNWEINQYGKDTEDPEVHEKHTLQQYKFSSVYDEKTYQTLLKNGFPSVEQLSEAYYLIKGDGNGKGKGTTIDLTGFTDFKGFGTEELPFTGVFIGEVDSSGNLAVEIKLPNQTSTASAFGFITYAKGAVVQNLKFTLPSNEEIEETTADGTKQLVEKVQMVQIAATRDKKNNYLSGGYGGAVFGCILGGDNVIANVTVSGSILAAEETSEIGGYVGRVEMGCLILRNMSSDSLKDFSIMTNEETGDTESASYNFIGGIAGAVEDGFVVADDETYENEYSGSNDLPASPLKGVVKYTTIQKAKIAVTDKDDSHQVTDYRLDTAEDLLVLSLAMNSGAMNYNARSEEVSRQAENYYAYDTTSKCRNTDYRYVGQMNTDTALAADSKQMQAYHAAVYYDNNKEMAKHADDDGEYEYSEYYYHPYIFNYFDFESYTYDSGKHDSCVLYVSNHKAQLNTIDKKSSFNYELEDGTYDLSGDGLQECFDGIGAKYHGLKTVDKPVASVVTKEQDIKVDTIPCEYDFIGNMTGDIEAPGKVKIILAITEGRTNNKSSSYAGFFNVLYAENSSDTPLQISGFTLTGSVTSTSDIVNDGDSNLAAGLAARVESPHTVSEVIVSDLAVTSDNGIAAGFVGCSHKNLTFKSCKLTSTEQKNILAKNSYAAGFVGKSDYDALTFETCEISSDDEDAAYEITSTTNVAGGFVAYGCRNVINTKNNLSQNKNQKADATPITFQNCSITCLNISTADTDKKEGAKKHLGGFVGACERKLEVNTADSAATTIQGLKIQAVKNNDNETGLGAIAGNLGNAAEIKNVTVSDAVIEYSNIVNGASSGCDAGGLIGFVNVDSADKKVNITGCTVGSLNLAESIQIGFAKATDRYAYFGGIVGFYNANTTLTLSGCKVVGVKDDYGAYTVQIQNGSYVGGLVGGGADGGAALNISDSSVSGVDMSVRRNEMSPTYNYDSVLGAAGGILGDTDSSNKTVVMDRITVSNVNITVDERKSDYAVGIVQGGVIGRVRCPVSITDVTVRGLALGNDGKCRIAGGLVGRQDSSALKVGKSSSGNTITNCTITAQKAGGLIGEQCDPDTNGPSANLSDITMTQMTVIGKYSNPYLKDEESDYAGGLVGYSSNTKSADYYTNITMNDSVVSGYPYFASDSDTSAKLKALEKLYLGGATGYQSATDYYGNLTFHNVLIGQMSVLETSELPTYENVTSATTRLYRTSYQDGSFQQVALQHYNYEGTNDFVAAAYTVNTGMLCGWLNTTEKQTYAVNLKVSYDNQLDCYRPAIDVGQTTAAFTDDMVVAYDNYRQYYHAVYGDYHTDATTENIGENLKNIQTIWESAVYQNHKASDKSNNDYRLDVSYKQDTTDNNNKNVNMTYDDIKAVYESTYQDEKGIISTLQDSKGNIIPMVVVNQWEYDANAVINTYLNILTNNGGAINAFTSDNTNSALVTVTVQKMKLENGESKADSGNAIISYDAATGTFSSSKEYDSYTDSKNATYTLITVVYKHNNQGIYTVQIPVFVKEILSVDSHMTYLEGNEYSLDSLTQTENCNVVSASIEHQSSYTIYSEYIYSAVRLDQTNVQLNKSIYWTDPSGKHKGFYKNTKLTLVDITGGGKAYYYVVPEENVPTEIQFTYFQDAEGNYYQTANLGNLGNHNNANYPTLDSYTDIHGETHENVGLEQFLIIVDETDTEDTKNETNRIKVDLLESVNPSLSRNVNYELQCSVNLTEIRGLLEMLSPDKSLMDEDATLTAAEQEKKNNYERVQTSDFHGADNETKKNKKNTMEFNENNRISQDGTIVIDGSVYVVSPSILDNKNISNYWNTTRTSTQPVYLEIAISIADSTGKKISIPNNTKVILNGDEDNPVYMNGDNGYIYYYQSAQKLSNPDLTKLTSDTLYNFSVKMDFSAADLSDINTENYQVYVDLYQYTKKDSPQSGEVLDTVSETIPGVGKKQLGFALHTDDILTLGMNGNYGDESDRGLVKFKTQIDFSDYVNSEEFTKYKNKDYTYTFVIRRKTAGNTGGNAGSDETAANVTYEYVEDENLANLIHIYQGSLTDLPTDENTAITSCTKYYSEDDILNAKDNNYILEEEFSLYADVAKLLENKDFITNYSVTCYVTISDCTDGTHSTGAVSADDTGNSGSTEDDGDVTQAKKSGITDFFIFTVAKIKTDMD